jgi:hypothetical protein
MDVKRELGDIAVELLGAGEIYRDAVVKGADIVKRSL